MKVWDSRNSLTYNTLRPLVLLMPLLGLNRFPNTQKKVVFIQILSCVIHVTALLSFVGKIIWCFVGAENSMEHKNISLYIALSGNLLVGIIFYLCGLIYVPTKLRNFLKICDDLRTDPLFDISYLKLKKFSKMFVIISLITVCVFTVVSMLVLNPPFASVILCFQSPVWKDSPFFWVSISLNTLTTSFCIAQKIFAFGMIYAFCCIPTNEFLKCDQEFKKMIDSEPTARKIETIRKRYVSIKILVEELDKLLCPFVSVAIGVAFTTVCFVVHVLIYGNVSHTLVVVNIVTLVMALSEIIIILAIAVSLHGTTTVCLETSQLLDGAKMNTETVGILTLYIDNMKSNHLGLTFLKLFVLDKATILTVFGSLISYVIVIVQFKPQ
ncbi:uncharacterized protein LOC126830358 [Patella vulgata]|uniref:uncharacterized protein LOC126830358 n=1 Tax=Patella vulgata TaxID=6465 RepID=UPI00217FFC43|nr:uncharacterized protein LOC126830358 [Patella vulgata]